MEFDYLLKKIPNIQRSSELISAYSLLETNLLKVCEILEKRIDNPVKIKDFNSDGYIQQAKIYLEKVVRIKFPSKSDEWKEILFIQNIRNSFVHSSGMVKTGNADLLTYIRKSTYLELTGNHQVQLKAGFTRHCLKIFKDFINMLLSCIEDKFNSKPSLIK